MSRKKGPTLLFIAVLWKLSDFPTSRSAETNKSNTLLKGELSSQEHKEDSETANKTRTLNCVNDAKALLGLFQPRLRVSLVHTGGETLGPHNTYSRGWDHCRKLGPSSIRGRVEDENPLMAQEEAKGSWLCGLHSVCSIASVVSDSPRPYGL